MARSMWTGAISFGLVTVPVRLFSAVEDKGISFRQLEKGTGSRIRYQRVAEDSGKEVEYGDIVKGYEIDKGRYVVVTPEELEAVEPGRSRTIDISDFVDLDAIDPIHFDRTYYLAPAEDVGAEKPYALLLQAMKDTGKVAVARFVMRGKQYLAAIRPMAEPSGEELLALETMHFPDEVRTAEDVDGIPVTAELSDRERRMAEQLIDSLSSAWDPTQYRDTYRERVLDLIERKAKGEDVVVEEPEEAPQVTDLLAALQASVEASRQRKAGGGAGGSGGAAGLASLSKDELYERASEADISGRSKMTKDELVEALEEEAS
jgi:DNA end-binding protein Ku